MDHLARVVAVVTVKVHAPGIRMIFFTPNSNIAFLRVAGSAQPSRRDAYAGEEAPQMSAGLRRPTHME
jgi:hypothetical protein